MANLTKQSYLSSPAIPFERSGGIISRSMTLDDGAHEPTPRKLRILMLHGYTQSSAVFRAKTKSLEKSLSKAMPPAPRHGHLKGYPGGIEMHFPSGPIHLDLTDLPDFEGGDAYRDREMYAWWRPGAELDVDAGLERLAEVLDQDGPFDAVIGFSQGGAAAALVASLLEPGRREAFNSFKTIGGMGFPEAFVRDGESLVQRPMKFAVAYSGFGLVTHSKLQAFYSPKLSTPMFHVLGTLDTVVEEKRSLSLVEVCVEGRGNQGAAPRIVYHPGGHFVPGGQGQSVAALVAFIREALGEDSGGHLGTTDKEDSIDDPAFPF